MSRVICTASVKGGSGKTVLCATFGTFLAAIGHRVLLVDTDAATNGLTLLYLHEVMLRREEVIHEGRRPAGLLEDGQSLDVVPLRGGLDLVPASYSLANTELVSFGTFSDRLAQALTAARDEYDFIFLDAQAGSEEFSGFCMQREVSDEVVIVSEYDPMSAAGVERLKAAFPDQLTYPRTWVLLNKMLPEFVSSFSDFLEVAKYLSPIPWDADVVRAYATRRLALDLEGGNEFTLAVFKALRTLLGVESRQRLDGWLSKQATMLKQPIEKRLEEVRAETAELYRIEQLAERKRWLAVSIAVVSVVALLAGAYLALQKPLFGSSTTFWVPLVMMLVAAAAMSMFVRTSDASPRERDMARRRLDYLFEREQKLEAMLSSEAEMLLRERKGVESELAG